MRKLFIFQDGYQSDIHNVLINNAGVCCSNNTFDSMKKSLLVNCLAPALLTFNFIHQYLLHTTIYADQPNELQMVAITRKVPRNSRLTVVNVSSGDGELLYLDSTIREKLLGIKSIEVSYIFSKACIFLIAFNVCFC